MSEITTSRVRVLIEVQAGVIPGQGMPEYHRKWAIPSDVWYGEGEWKDRPLEAQEEVIKIYGHANEYARTLWNPSRVNWVQLNWLYL